MQSGQAGSPIWLRAESELKLREARQRARQDSEGTRATTRKVADSAHDLSFIKKAKLRKVAEADLNECQRALATGCNKCAAILAGEVIEAILLDKLSRRTRKARATAAAKGKGTDLSWWPLGILIEAARELRLIDPEIEALPKPVKEYRNTAHPGAQVRNRLEIDEKTAKLIFHILEVVISKRRKRGPANAHSLRHGTLSGTLKLCTCRFASVPL